MGDVEIKGFAIRGVLKYAKQSHPGGISGLLGTLESDDATLFDNAILATSWYPYRTFTVLLDALTKAKKWSNSDLFEVGVFSGTQDAGSIFRIVMSLASVERVISACPRFWKRYSSAGDFEILGVEKGRVEVALNNFAEIHPGHCHLAAGWMKGLGETAGARNGEIQQTKCVHRGDDRCEFVATWS